MTLIAHVSGVPVEELVLPLAYGGGSLWLAARAWLSGHRGTTSDQAPDQSERRTR